MIQREFDYTPGKPDTKVDLGDRKLLVIADSITPDANLTLMIQRFMESYAGEVELAELSQIPNLREIISALTELDQANLCGIVTDEFGESKDVDALLQSLAGNLVRDADKEYIKPVTFRGVGGRKIFRDDICGRGCP